MKMKPARPILPKKSWGRVCLSVFLMLAWVFAATIASWSITRSVMVGALGEEKFRQTVWQAVFAAVYYALAFGLVMFVPKKTIGRTELGLRGLPTWTDIGLAPAGFLVYWLMAGGLIALFSLLPWFNAFEIQRIGFDRSALGFDKSLAFIALVIVAPIAEELIFRGWLYGKIRAKFNEVIANRYSIFLSTFLVSLLFGLVHMQWNVMVNVFALSVVLCALREITGTIYAGILLHMLKNGVAFYLAYVFSGMI